MKNLNNQKTYIESWITNTLSTLPSNQHFIGYQYNEDYGFILLCNAELEIDRDFARAATTLYTEFRQKFGIETEIIIYPENDRYAPAKSELTYIKRCEL